jgi:glutathione synthase/RimK-type ligase-like ATP-grasp enzyme
LLQREVKKLADYRVTVVGQELFAARITTPEEAPLDVRATSAAECDIAIVELPEQVCSQCLAFTEASGLRFAAFDLGEAIDGSFWFFESNPNGQWGWIELATGAPITDALVDLLMSEEKP